ncbi:hypothetical protein BIV25_22115 [Streptomyces sp. MUSC 14]|nr:hypothetical protein BIV25_22115 [Streptomyces sp. MUSC 14]
MFVRAAPGPDGSDERDRSECERKPPPRSRRGTPHQRRGHGRQAVPCGHEPPRPGDAARRLRPLLAGCSDSRPAAEIIFDQGPGDLFVVRTAGHAAGPEVLGSIEYGVSVLDCPLVVVLGHGACGAVADTCGT